MKPAGIPLHWQAGTLALAAAFVLASVYGASVQAQTSSDARSQIGQAYAAVLQAEASGGNVTYLVKTLNSAVTLVQQGDLVNGTDPGRAQALYSQASSLAQQVIQNSSAVAASGRASVANAQIALGVETAALAALAVVAYVYTPRVFWRLWLRIHRDWRVKKR